MEGRKLNFNAPLLSVRRYTNTSVQSSDRNKGNVIGNSRPSRRYTIPFYRSDMNSEQVTEPVAVPFLWEQIPGRPKDGGSEPQEEVSVTPRLPTSRNLDVVKYSLEKEVDKRQQTDLCVRNDIVSRLDSIKQENIQKGNPDFENKDDDEVYADALDALTPNDSFSMNCSVSGLSGSDGEVMKPSGTFATDPQTRDFMMRRFLPAAKAMALEPPQYASRKQPAAAIEQPNVAEQPKMINKVVSGEIKPSLNQSIVVSHYFEDVDDEEESEEEVEEYDEAANISSKGCGLLPRLCLNKSLGRLNPVPALRVRTNSSVSSSSESGVRKPVKAAVREPRAKTVKKSASDVAYKHQPDTTTDRSPRLLLGMGNKMTCGSTRFAHSGELPMTSRSSPFRRAISPYRNERPQSPFRGGGFLGVPKETENKSNRLNLYGRAGSKSQEFPRPSFNKVSGSMSPAVEKTLYIDTVKFAKSSSLQSSPTRSRGLTPRRRRGTEQDAITNFPLQSHVSQNTAKGVTGLEPQKFEYVQPRRSFSGLLRPRTQADGEEYVDTKLEQECKSLECIKVTADDNLSSGNEKNFGVDDPGFEQSPLPPPLPKTPSESWLGRTLPSVPSRNPFTHSYISSRFIPKIQDTKLPLTNTKWETIVKTSYSRHDHSRYSEELTSHFSKQSKT